MNFISSEEKQKADMLGHQVGRRQLPETDGAVGQSRTGFSLTNQSRRGPPVACLSLAGQSLASLSLMVKAKLVQ